MKFFPNKVLCKGGIHLLDPCRRILSPYSLSNPHDAEIIPRCDDPIDDESSVRIRSDSIPILLDHCWELHSFLDEVEKLELKSILMFLGAFFKVEISTSENISIFSRKGSIGARHKLSDPKSSYGAPFPLVALWSIQSYRSEGSCMRLTDDLFSLSFSEYPFLGIAIRKIGLPACAFYESDDGSDLRRVELTEAFLSSDPGSFFCSKKS